MLKSRRQAREAALKALYGMEISKGRISDAIQELNANSGLSSELLQFAKELVEGVSANLAFIDDLLAARIQDYDFDRIASVDRTLLRIAAYEIHFCEQIPPAVTINEAIELAKKYSTAESGRFVNGVLGKVLADSLKAGWDSAVIVGEVEDCGPPEPDPEVETIDENAPEADAAARFGKWQVRSGGDI